VQYRETDLDFISRLLEEEGIFYFFEHTDQKHLLVFGDSTVNYKPIPGEPKVVFNPTGGMVVREESVYQFAFSRQIRSGKYTLRDFNFEKPTLDLTAQDKATAHQELEVYDYPGEYLEQAPGKRLAKIRLEEAVMFKDLAKGNSSCPRFTPGFTYKMTKHEHSQFNKEYLLLRVVHSGTQPQVLEELADPGSTFSYANEFSALPSSVTFRPERDTPKPIVEGVHTAIVVGPKGEEIYTDKYGRVKVQFHWDRLGKNDENSSCWIRVSQGWAGGGWGAVFLPRIKQEVIVDFLEGDPDHPIITGRVYHGTNMPPYPLPDEKTKSTVMSNSSLGGKGSNEMRFEDKKGSEEIFIHAQKDMNEKIENNHSTTVGTDRTITVGGTHTENITGDTKITIKQGIYEHDVAVGTAKYHVMADLTETYDATQSTTVAREITITSSSASINITAATEISLTVGASSLLMKSDGSIKLSGVDVAINGAGSVNIHGMSVTSKADADHNISGAIVLSEGSATNTVKGGMVMLNP
jgi:type VI secretion system secreted protein VgrG